MTAWVFAHQGAGRCDWILHRYDSSAEAVADMIDYTRGGCAATNVVELKVCTDDDITAIEELLSDAVLKTLEG